MTDRIISSSAVVLKKVKPSVYLGKVGYMADTVSAVMMKSGDSLMQSLCVGFGRGGFISATGLRFGFFLPAEDYKDEGEYRLKDILHARSEGIIDLIGKEVYYGEEPLSLLKMINSGEAKTSKLMDISARSVRYPFRLKDGPGCVIVRRHDGQTL